jgi:hypothetical protein
MWNIKQQVLEDIKEFIMIAGFIIGSLSVIGCICALIVGKQNKKLEKPIRVPVQMAGPHPRRH